MLTTSAIFKLWDRCLSHSWYNNNTCTPKFSNRDLWNRKACLTHCFPICGLHMNFFTVDSEDFSINPCQWWIFNPYMRACNAMTLSGPTYKYSSWKKFKIKYNRSAMYMHKEIVDRSKMNQCSKLATNPYISFFAEK